MIIKLYFDKKLSYCLSLILLYVCVNEIIYTTLASTSSTSSSSYSTGENVQIRPPSLASSSSIFIGAIVHDSRSTQPNDSDDHYQDHESDDHKYLHATTEIYHHRDKRAAAAQKRSKTNKITVTRSKNRSTLNRKSKQPVTETSFASSQSASSSTFASLTESELNALISEATANVRQLYDTDRNSDEMRKREQRLRRRAWFIGESWRCSPTARNISRSALIAETATRLLARRHRWNAKQIAEIFDRDDDDDDDKAIIKKHNQRSLQSLSVRNVSSSASSSSSPLTMAIFERTTLSRKCPRVRRPPACYAGRFRSASGHCNNVQHADWGSANSPYRRSLPARYDDAISAPRKQRSDAQISSSPTLLPSARDISLALHRRDEIRNDQILADSNSSITTLHTFFAEFIFDDIAHTAQSTHHDGEPIRCCPVSERQTLQPQASHPECFPILSPNFLLRNSSNSSSNSSSNNIVEQDCFEYVRSAPAIRSGCTLGRREQINQATAYLDASPLYGSSRRAARRLRTFTGGQLKAITPSVETGFKDMLMPIENDDNGDDDNVRCRSSAENGGNQAERCFRSGDDRVNRNMGIAMIHTLLLREHNRIARRLAAINPEWSDERLYQETRKIVGAQIQHITYSELLPYIIGEELINRYSLRLRNDGYSHDYDMTVNAAIDNSVANSAAHFLMSKLPQTMQRFTTNLRPAGEIHLVDSFFRSAQSIGTEMHNDGHFDQFLLGMIGPTNRRQQQSNRFVMDDLINMPLFFPAEDNTQQKMMFDFVAFAIQQGRDHGLPPYVEYRRMCEADLRPKTGTHKSSTINNFDDLIGTISPDTVKQIKSIYKSVHDIDLLTGALSEIPATGALVGPTFGCLIGRQFRALRRGDRFWYESSMPPSAFTAEQLSEIRRTSIARLICDNGDAMRFVQPDPMITFDAFLNAFQFCHATSDSNQQQQQQQQHSSPMPGIDLTQWRSTQSDDDDNFLTSTTSRDIVASSSMIDDEMIRARHEIDDLFRLERNQSLMERSIHDQLLASASSSSLSSSQSMLHAVKRSRPNVPTMIAIGNHSLQLERATRGILRRLRGGRDRESSADIFTDIDDLVRALPHVELHEYMRRNVLSANRFDDDFVRRCDDRSLPCDHTAPFRSATGWCNNLRHADFGKSLTVFERFLPAFYEDGVSVPRTKSFVGARRLPSPRSVSFTVHDNASTPHTRYSLAVMQWGQLLDHDMTLTPAYQTSTGDLLNCKQCDSTLSVHPECNPIPIPNNDPFFSPGTCLHFVRSLNAQQRLGPREQMNRLTAYIDASIIYGSDNCDARRLRTHRSGRLNVTRHPLGGTRKDLMPLFATNPECKAPSGRCFLSGDLRASEQPALAALHTVLLREHNRIVTRLARINAHWSDEQLYQTGRKIVSALMQQITYREFLPRLIGEQYISRFGLRLERNGYYHNYDPTCSATIRNEISAAVFRLGHTLLKPSFERLDARYKVIKQPLRLRESFFNSDMLFSAGAIDELLRGLVTSSIETFDHAITDEVTNHLFEERGRPFSGMDLIALNLQRSRDHGLQPYNRYREMCNLTRARRFDDFSEEISPSIIAKLQRVYEHVDDIDLFSGGIAETPLHGALVGPTFACLLAMQFAALRRCDRFWYETSNQYIRFTESQLRQIRKVMLGKLICTNGDNISHIQRNVLDIPDPHINPRISCKSLPQIDLNKWKDGVTGDGTHTCTHRKMTIARGTHRHISPCVDCACTQEGMICESLRILDCERLKRRFALNEIESDQACMVQCAFAMRKNLRKNFGNQ